MLYVKIIDVLKLSFSFTYHSFEKLCPDETLFCFELLFRLSPSSLMMANICRILKWSIPLPLSSIIFIIYSTKFHLLLQFSTLFPRLPLHLSASRTLVFCLDLLGLGQCSICYPNLIQDCIGYINTKSTTCGGLFFIN